MSIVDLADGKASDPRDILIIDGTIVEVAESSGLPRTRAANVLRAEGLYALPGLIDVHAHIGDGGIGAQSEEDRQGALSQFVRYGVTTIFVPGGGGGNDHQLARFKERCAARELSCPGLYGSGALVTAPGSHPIGTIWDMPDDVDPALVYERGAVALAEDEPAGPLLELKLARGVDAIKIVIEDGPGPWHPKPRLSDAKIQEIARASHDRGLRVFAHVSRLSHVEAGVKAGVDGIMHSSEDPIPEPVLTEMAAQGIFYVATLALYDGFFDHALGLFVQEPFALAGVSRRALDSLEDEAWRDRPSDPPDSVEPMRQAVFGNLRRAWEAGVPLALGTDVNNPTVFPGYSAHEELALMVEAGLTPIGALRAATQGGAAFLGQESTLGKLAPGYEADVLILTANPLRDIMNTRALHAVVSDGRVVDEVVRNARLPADQPRRARTVVLHDVTVIDGTGSIGRPHQVVMVEGDRIARLGPVGEIEIPAGARVMDFSGKYVVPGFVDLHVHFPADPEVHDAMLARLLEFGVTTMLNPGARPGAGVSLRQRIASGEAVGPRMLTAGRIIDHEPVDEGLAHWAAHVTSHETMRREIRRQAALGVDWIKLYRHVPPELVETAIKEAHELGLPVVGHMGATTWGEAARAGIGMLVHSGWGTPMDEVVNLSDPESATDTEWYQAYADAPNGEPFAKLAATLANEEVVVVSTLSITQASGLGSDATLLPQFRVDLAPDAHVSDWWSEGWQHQHPQYDPDDDVEAALMASVYVPGALGIVKAYYDRGVHLAIGTDVGNSWMTPGFVYHHELSLYQKAGIPPLEILKMATHNGAQALGILSEIGTVEVGKRADLVVLGSDPSRDVRNTRDVEAVFLGGELMPSSASAVLGGPVGDQRQVRPRQPCRLDGPRTRAVEIVDADNQRWTGLSVSSSGQLFRVTRCSQSASSSGKVMASTSP